jgi:pimeloyl-ACP methyl ester carboxylesterase
VTTSDPSFPVRLSTLRWGNPDARPAALLLHGLTSAAGTWWRVASDLAAAGWSVTAPDLRGHGASPRTTRYALHDYAADVAALRPEGGGAWDLVVGHSLGGAITTAVAEADPRWTASAVLLDPVLDLPQSQRDAVLADLLGELGQLDAAALLREHSLHRDDPDRVVAEALAVAAQARTGRAV